MRINVGPSILTINHGTTFMVSDLAGQIYSTGYLGIFANDTRFLSYYGCYINGYEWTRINSTTTTYYAARIYLTNPTLIAKNGEIPAGTLSFVISRLVESGIREELELTNHSLQPVSFNLEIALRSDFADVFEVESQQFVRRGQIETEWNRDQQELLTTYRSDNFYRCLTYQVGRCSSPVHYANGRITFEITLQPGEVWQTDCNYILSDGEHTRNAIDYRYQDAVDRSQATTEIERLHEIWCRSATIATTSHETVKQLYRQSVEDLGALRLFDYDYRDDVWVAAAGVPKFVTLFGRDSLIASLQTMIVHPNFALGAIRKLAELQATEMDDWRDAQPGKILHEIRRGELAQTQQIPFGPYYGTADATALFLITLHEAWKWLGDDSLLRDYREQILRALEWIDRYGDLDDDGFQEYKVRSSSRYRIDNQGWKDSGDAIVYPDGTQVQAPIALCELQGYAFDAQMRMAEVFEHLGEPERATTLRTKATQLQTRFEEKFWCEDIGFYAFALDPEKHPVKTIASNVGHCLWSGIIRPDRAARVVNRLLQPDMWSGWGIRTLSSQNPAYNPFSYHRGTVWAHDNSIIAMGFKRYGFAPEVAQVAEGIFDTGNYFASYRLPELYAGVSRQPGNFPAPYLQANIPHAWAAASVFQLLQAILGLRADAPNHCLYVDPHLPEWLPEITLQRVEVGNALVDLKFWRKGEQTHWDATVNGDSQKESGTLEVKAQAWQPWSAKRDLIIQQ